MRRVRWSLLLGLRLRISLEACLILDATTGFSALSRPSFPRTRAPLYFGVAEHPGPVVRERLKSLDSRVRGNDGRWVRPELKQKGFGCLSRSLSFNAELSSHPSRSNHSSQRLLDIPGDRLGL